MSLWKMFMRNVACSEPENLPGSVFPGSHLSVYDDVVHVVVSKLVSGACRSRCHI
jgi:hypothetical protein